MEVDDAADPVGAGGKESSAEVQGTLLLTESAAGNDADAGGLEHAHAVELVGSAALLLGSLGGLCGKLDGGEEVHGALGRAAFDALHLIKGLVESGGALLEAVEDTIVFLLVQLVARLALLGRVDHELDDALADDGSAKGDGDELVDVGLDLGVEVDKLKVAAAVAALTNHTLGDRVQGGEFDTVVLAGGLLLQLAQNALEGVELANEDVGLVNFVSHHHKLLLRSVVVNGANVILGQGGTGRVAGVDNDNSTNIGAFGGGLLVGGLDSVQIGTPACGLVEVVRNAGGVEDRQCCGVERVLGNGHQNTALGVLGDDVKEGVDTGRGTAREVNVGGIGGESVTACRDLCQFSHLARGEHR